MVNRRKLILMTAAAIGLVGASLAPSLVWLYAASFLVGLASVIPQVIITLAAQMAEPEQQGEVLGVVVSGLLIGCSLELLPINWRVVGMEAKVWGCGGSHAAAVHLTS
ncbi:hypothetical protein BK127_40245 [Paenibacillus sp. FSL H7-0331]|nr:hypothetical protein [Paenibacillus sp. FSL H7-0331]OME97805.1 hypothetical protein BK127_40245 [Paenibacillus sp. FSL H7-0331]